MERLADQPGIVIGFPKQMAAAAIAGEQKRTMRRLPDHQITQILVGRGCVPDLELDCRPDRHHFTDGQRSILRIHSNDRANEKVATFEIDLAFVDDSVEVQPVVSELAFVLVE